jgi:uncharacterized protein (TIGR02217 family)
MPLPDVRNVVLSNQLAPGASGGDRWPVEVIETDSGGEQRVNPYSVPRWKGSFRFQGRAIQHAEELNAFWNAMEGMTYGFLFQVPDDYRAVDTPLVPTGGPTIQLTKSYVTGAYSKKRTIYKPKTGTLTCKRGGSPYTDFTVDTNTGIVTLDYDDNPPISDITQDTQAVITLLGPSGLLVGDVAYITGVAGMTQINGAVAQIVDITGFDVTVDLDTTGYSAYSSGGEFRGYIQPDEALTASFEFYLPVRFAMEMPEIVAEDGLAFAVEAIQLEELLS